MKPMNLLFEHVLKDSENTVIQTVRIYDEERENVTLITDDEEKVFTIMKEDKNKIRDILWREKKIYDVRKWPFPFVEGGVSNKFYLRGVKRREIYVTNLFYFLEHDGPAEVKTLIQVFEEISIILKKYGMELYLHR